MPRCQGPALPQSQLDGCLGLMEAGGREGGGGGGGGEWVPLARLVRLQAAVQHRDYTAALDLLHRWGV